MCQNTVNIAFFFTVSPQTQAASSSQPKRTDCFQNPLHNNACRKASRTKRSLHKRERRRPQKDTQFWYFFSVQWTFSITNSPKLTLVTFIPPEMHLYSRKCLENITGKNLFLRLALLPRKIAGNNWGISHKKVVFTVCTEHPDTRPAIQKFAPRRLACIFLIEFSLSGWANREGKNTRRRRLRTQ